MFCSLTRPTEPCILEGMSWILMFNKCESITTCSIPLSSSGMLRPLYVRIYSVTAIFKLLFLINTMCEILGFWNKRYNWIKTFSGIRELADGSNQKELSQFKFAAYLIPNKFSCIWNDESLSHGWKAKDL